MLGAVIALQRGEHMRLTTFVVWSPQPLRRLFDALAWVVPMVFLAWMLPYAIEHTLSEAVVSTPSLEWPAATKIAAIPVGVGLMIVLSADPHDRDGTVVGLRRSSDPGAGNRHCVLARQPRR